MHDPMILAWDIKSPFKDKSGYRRPLVTIWHNDPETDGTDDSCGWFKRERHGDKSVMDKIVKRFEEDWDRTWTYDPSEDGDGTPEEMEAGKKTYPRGMFNPSGMPRFSTTGIVLNLFFIAANEHFKCNGLTNWKKSKSFMRRNMFDILLFAENPTDSLYDSITLQFGNDTRRKERIRNMAGIIYGWILREDQRWWQHPRWHIHHWSFQFHDIQALKRMLFSRCCKCGKGFKWHESPVSNQWDGIGPRWFQSEECIMHGDCSGVGLACSEKASTSPG